VQDFAGPSTVSSRNIPPNHPFTFIDIIDGIFHEINHPFGGTMTMETSISMGMSGS
jgi:hypothetical protein